MNLVWIADLVCGLPQTSVLTPPFGWALSALPGVAPPEVKTGDLSRGVMPFIALQVAATVLVFLFPTLATWLPGVIGR